MDGERTQMNFYPPRNEFLLFFHKSTGGYQVWCRIENRQYCTWPYVGVLRNGREMTPRGCRKYVDHYIVSRRAQDPHYFFRVDDSKLPKEE